jgi:hypothetical protein
MCNFLKNAQGKNRPIGENSANLVALVEILSRFFVRPLLYVVRVGQVVRIFVRIRSFYRQITFLEFSKMESYEENRLQFLGTYICTCLIEAEDNCNFLFSVRPKLVCSVLLL